MLLDFFDVHKMHQIIIFFLLWNFFNIMFLYIEDCRLIKIHNLIIDFVIKVDKSNYYLT